MKCHFKNNKCLTLHIHYCCYYISEYVSGNPANKKQNLTLWLIMCVCVCARAPRSRALQQETLTGLWPFFWITLVALLPRQQQLENNWLPSREWLCFRSNQGQGEGSGFYPILKNKDGADIFVIALSSGSLGARAR